MDNWYVYIAKAKTGYLYTGASNDVPKRIKTHNSGKGSKFARMHGELRLVYTFGPVTKSEALKREIQIKGWSRSKKEKLINGEWV